MNLYEYQAKECFREFGIATPRSVLAGSLDEVKTAAEELGFPCMLKSQILRGGRGKLGLIKRVTGLDEAQRVAADLFASQYGVKTLLIEQCVAFAQELYLSISIDPVPAQAVIMLCPTGGVEIESIAEENPELMFKAYADVDAALDESTVDDLVARAGLSGKLADGAKAMIVALFACFQNYDAELAEINPVFVTAEGDVVAGDGKLVIDDNSLFRQTKFEATRAYFSSDMEYEAAQNGIPYIQFDGDISLMCAGAGLTNTVYDLINYEGGSVANYLEFGGPNYTKGQTAMELCLRNESKVILIVTFGTIARADVIAEGVVNACAKLGPDRPLVTCIRGTNEEAANEMLKAAGLECFSDTEQAVRRAIALAAERKGR